METNQQALNLLFAPSKSSHKYSSQHLKHVYENYVKDYISVDDFEKLIIEIRSIIGDNFAPEFEM